MTHRVLFGSTGLNMGAVGKYFIFLFLFAFVWIPTTFAVGFEQLLKQNYQIHFEYGLLKGLRDAAHVAQSGPPQNSHLNKEPTKTRAWAIYRVISTKKSASAKLLAQIRKSYPIFHALHSLAEMKDVKTELDLALSQLQKIQDLDEKAKSSLQVWEEELQSLEGLLADVVDHLVIAVELFEQQVKAHQTPSLIALRAAAETEASPYLPGHSSGIGYSSGIAVPTIQVSPTQSIEPKKQKLELENQVVKLSQQIHHYNKLVIERRKLFETYFIDTLRKFQDKNAESTFKSEIQGLELFEKYRQGSNDPKLDRVVSYISAQVNAMIERQAALFLSDSKTVAEFHRFSLSPNILLTARLTEVAPRTQVIESLFGGKEMSQIGFTVHLNVHAEIRTPTYYRHTTRIQSYFDTDSKGTILEKSDLSRQFSTDGESEPKVLPNLSPVLSDLIWNELLSKLVNTARHEQSHPRELLNAIDEAKHSVESPPKKQTLSPPDLHGNLHFVLPSQMPAPSAPPWTEAEGEI